jgi:hypothetical protein
MLRRNRTGPCGMGRRLSRCCNELEREDNVFCHGRARNNNRCGFKKSYHDNANLKKNMLKEKAELTRKLDFLEKKLNTL